MNANRSFLKKVLAAGVDCGEIEPADILGHVTPQMLAHHLPVELKAKLLGASLDAREMSPELVVQVVGIDALTEHSPVSALWACVKEAVEARLEEAPKEAPGGASEEAPKRPAPRSRRRRSRASTEADAPSEEDGELPRKPNRSAQPGGRNGAEPETTVPEGARVTEAEGSAGEGEESYEVEFEEAIDELVADEPSGFEESPSLFDIDTKVGGPSAPVGEFTDDDTSPGAKRRGEG